MTPPDLESLTPGLDRACADILGDRIEYAANGAAFEWKRAHVDYREASKAFQEMEAIAQDIMVTIPKADVPARPNKDVRLRLPKMPGQVFKPVAPRSDESGTHWEFEVKDVPNA